MVPIEKLSLYTVTPVTGLDVVLSGNRIQPVDFTGLRGGTRFLALMPQWDFLNFIVAEASKLPHFRLMQRSVQAGGLDRQDRLGAPAFHAGGGGRSQARRPPARGSG